MASYHLGEEGAIGFCCGAPSLQELVFHAVRLEIALACEFARRVLQLRLLVCLTPGAGDRDMAALAR
eukprot:5032784-Alexandrium_andersonii.AAC.1